MNTLDILKEIDRRGLEPPERYRAVYDEAKRRGILRTDDRRFLEDEASGLQRIIGGHESTISTLSNVAGGLASDVAAVGLSAIESPTSALGGFLRDVGITREQATTLPAQIQEALTYEPRTRAGRATSNELKREIGNVLRGTVIEDAGNLIGGLVNDFRNSVRDETGSEVLANAAVAAPSLLIDIIPAALPVRGLKAGVKPRNVRDVDVRDALVESEVDLRQLAQLRDEAYNELGAQGLRVKSGTASDAIQHVRRELAKQEIDVDLQRANPVFDQLDKRFSPQRVKEGNVVTSRREKLSDIENIKKFINANAPADAFALKSASRAALDDFIENTLPTRVVGQQPENVKKLFDTARGLAGRVTRTRQIDEMFELAANSPNPGQTLQRRMRVLLNNANKRKFFSQSEIQAMREIASGKVTETKIQKFAGRLGVEPTSAATGIARLLKVFGGSTLRRSPIISTTRRLTQGATKRADNRNIEATKAVRNQVAAGAGVEDTVTSYLKAIPKKNRSSEELGQILADGNFNLRDLELRGSKLEREALEIARGIRFQRVALGVAATNTLEQEVEQ